MSAELLSTEAVAQFGRIGSVLGLVGTEHTLFVSVGVPWLEQQLRSLLEEPNMTEEERYLITSLYTSLGCKDWVEVFDEMVRQAETPRVVVALLISSLVLKKRQPEGERGEKWRRTLLALDRKRRRFGTIIAEVLEVKDQVLEVERQRIRRIQGMRAN